MRKTKSSQGRLLQNRLLRATISGIGLFAIMSATLGSGSADESKKAESPKFSNEALDFYDKEVLPVLKANCLKCHGTEKPKGNFSLAVREAILKGGELGPAVDLAKPDESNLIKAIHFRDGLEMPPTGKLKAPEIDILTKWVKAGLPMRDGGKVVIGHESKGGVVTPESKNYWAYRPVTAKAPPTTKRVDGNVHPIDAFIASKLDEKGLAPADTASPIALVRRVYFDLTGLPPSPEQVDDYLKDPSPKAYEALIDRLLNSRHYGERWGRHWLDVVRYAETNGYERDGPKPEAWRYRDYVIRSFNNDKPYDRFIKEQLAGDEMTRAGNQADPDPIIATGFYRLGLWDDEPADPKLAMFDELDDIVATVSQAFLGMTMNCARCHEHKIDPIPHADYYRMAAFFRDIKRFSNDRNPRSTSNLTDISPPDIRSTYAKALAERMQQIADLTKQMIAYEEKAIKKMPAEDQRASEGIDRPAVVKKVPMYLDDADKTAYLKLRKERSALERLPDPTRENALSVNNCYVKPPVTNVLIRGNPSALGAVVEPGFPEVLGFDAPKIPEPTPDAKSSGRRTVVADWIASPKNPLTARVWVNRVWQKHFGRGIVASANDFGKFGTGATHADLLDWLADDFVKNGWKTKRLHKQIMMSQTYRRSAVASAEAIRLDPANMLFGRFTMRRLSAEEVRDALLAVSGKLNMKPGGPSVYPKIPREVLAGQSRPGEGWPTSSAEEGNRRSVYVHIKRSLQVPILSVHDQADTDTSCPVRYTTIVPTQALGMLNGEFANEIAAGLADRVTKETADPTDRVRRAIRLTTGRIPNADEIRADLQLVRDLETTHKLTPTAALKQYCLMALNTNEFIFVD